MSKGILMKIIDAASLGNAIRQRRKELKYTQGNISEITGFSVSFLSDLENGKPTAEIGKTIEIINLLGLDIIVEARGDE
jgi:y4mF family transcriptional regulator